jgi:hypothetical protein
MLRFLTTLLFCVLLQATASAQDSTKAASIPADYNNPKYILLIQKRTQGITKGRMNSYFEKTFTRNYSGRFELASWEEIQNDPKYQNTEVYRYVLRDKVDASTATTRTQYGAAGRSEFSYTNDYWMELYLHDRVSNQALPTVAQGSSPAKAITSAAKRLNTGLKK